jgi:hypothetical protein
VKNILLLIGLVFLVGCTTGNCRSQKGPNSDINPAREVLVTEKIKVFKYDGSLQCETGKAISLAEMQKELQGIEVFGSENKSDGLMRIQVCGSPTGRANVYEINKKDLQTVLDKGFRVWTYN